jgi:hypothetical protein
MKRPLLILVPVLALFLMACPQKHTTSSNTPPAPDPNGYHAPVETGTSTQIGYDGNASTNNNTSNSSTSTNTNSSSNSSAVATNGSTQSKDTIEPVLGRPNPYVNDSVAKTRFVVSLVSHGGGIDLEAQKKLDKYLVKHPDVKYFQSQWGREGEVDYCFYFTDRKGPDQEKAINEIKTVIGTNDKVLYKENVVCKHKHEEGAVTLPVAEEAPVEQSKPDTSNTARVVVSFISQGQGIDIKAKDRLLAWLKEQNVSYEEKFWGREGEVNVCIALKEKRDSRQQEIFVRDLRTFIGENPRVIVDEWGKCDKRK